MTQAAWKDIRRLMTAFRSGDTAAFRYIYDRHHGALWFFAYQMVDDTAEAEDIVAEAFFKVWERRESFDLPFNIGAYLKTIVRNACLDHLKHKKRRAESEDKILYLAEEEDSYLEASMIQAELLNTALLQMKDMPDKMREVYKLTYVDGLNHAEIAEKLNITEATVRNQKKKALAFVKKKLDKNGPPVVLLLVGGDFLIKLIFRL